MCTAVTVASLPGLKSLILRGGLAPNRRHNRSSRGYVKPGSALPISTTGTSQTYIEGGKWNDNLELVFLDRESLPDSTGMPPKDPKDVVMVTKDSTVTHI